MGVGGRRVGRILTVLTAVAVCGLAVVATTARAGVLSPGQEWTWPLAGSPPVTRAFAPPEVRYGTGHRGVDLAGAPGAAVLAAGDGRVSYAGLLAGRGVVVVQHGELRTTYEPVTALVGVGQSVAAGDPLGRLDAGHAGCPVAACLHWGLRRGQTYLDPLTLVGAGPVRLLPVGDGGGGSTRPTVPTRLPGPVPVPVPVAGTPAPESAPGFDLRAAASPSGALAVLALLAGLALLVRPGPPHRPAGGTAVEVPGPVTAVEAHDNRPRAPVLDLGHERARRAVGR